MFVYGGLGGMRERDGWDICLYVAHLCRDELTINNLSCLFVTVEKHFPREAKTQCIVCIVCV